MHRSRILALLALTLPVLAGIYLGGPAMAAPVVDYLSDPGFDRILFSTQGFGVLGMDVCAHRPDQTPLPLRVNGVDYARGLGHHAPGQIVVDLGGDYARFEAEVGVEEQGHNIGSVVFRVYVDDQLRFDSGIMRESDSAKPVSVDVHGAQELRLEVTDAGDGITCDCADWCDARLVRAHVLRPGRALGTFDAGLFGQIVTCDPARMDGARSDRVHEFQPGDVFLEMPVERADDGSVTLPIYADHTGCLGLRWAERRMITRAQIVFAAGQPLPDPARARLELWSGEGEWQGEWKPVAEPVRADGDTWTVALKPTADLGRHGGIWKLRWVIPGAPEGLRVAHLHAFTRSMTQDLAIHIEAEGVPEGEKARVSAYNGWILTDSGARKALSVDWDASHPLAITVRHTRSSFWKSDATLLRFRLPGRPAFSVAVDDLLSHPCVYVKPAGVFVTRADTGLTLAAWKARIRGRETVLERVRQMPDQTFERAWEHVHDPVQSKGPVMLSLACDNRKFIVHRDGTIQFSTVPDVPDPLLYYPQKYPCSVRPQAGSGGEQEVTRHLDSGWLPIPVMTETSGGIEYSQRSYVAPIGDGDAADMYRKDILVSEYTQSNLQKAPKQVRLTLDFVPNTVVFRQFPHRIVVVSGDQVLAVVDSSEAPGLELSAAGSSVTLSGKLAAGASTRCVMYLPAWFVAPKDEAQIGGWEDLLAATRSYWRKLMSTSTQIDIPDRFLDNTIRASQVHCLIAARSEDGGARVAPWIASNTYGPLASEANSIVSGMDLLGHADFTRRCLDFFIHRYAPQGYLTTGYVLIGTGWHLASLGEYYDLTRNDAWMRKVAPKVDRACEWIERQREMTMKTGPDGERLLGYGLVPPGVTADWGLFSYRMYNQAHYCEGLREAGGALAAIDYPGAKKLVADAGDFRHDIVDAYTHSQALAAALPLQDGTWVPGSPSTAETFGLLKDVYPGEDGNRSWAYDVEIGSHQLISLGILDPESKQAGWIMQQLEDGWLLDTGMGDYAAEKNHKDWFDLGGFAKVQPYYGRLCEAYALRDDVKPFIRSYFNAIPSLLNPETLTFWEHFHNQGAWCKTHETGEFLRQTRYMFVMERGDELWLAPFATNVWMKDGEKIAVRNAPTRFGPVSYEIDSHVGEGYIEATIEPPTRQAPKAVVVRLRHPEGKPMRKVTVNGKEWKDFDAAKEIVRVEGVEGKVVVKAEY